MGFLNEARREFIAAPDEAKSQIVYKWPDQNIRKFARAIVEPDAVAVFMSQGQLMGVLGPGQHRLEASELPFLGMFVDWGSNSNAFKAELYFVGAREFPRCRFGGRLDEVQDPQTGLIVTLRAFGEYALRVIDPTKLIINLVGTVDVTDNEAITGWVAQQLLKVTRTAITTNLMSGALADPGPVRAQPGDRGRHPARGERPAGRLRAGHRPVRQPGRQPGRRRQRAAEEAGRGHRLLAAGRRLPAGGPGRGAAGRRRGHGPGRRRGRPDVPRGRLRHRQPDDAARRPPRPRRPRRRPPRASPAVARGTPRRRSRLRPRRRPRPRPRRAATASPRSRSGRSSAPSAARRCRSTARTATPA